MYISILRYGKRGLEQDGERFVARDCVVARFWRGRASSNCHSPVIRALLIAAPFAAHP
jgi:hypothetical protein